jgi:solute carrier family 41
MANPVAIFFPQIAAMLISCATGVVLEKSVSRYEGFALLGVTMTGICGSLGAI